MAELIMPDMSETFHLDRVRKGQEKEKNLQGFAHVKERII